MCPSNPPPSREPAAFTAAQNMAALLVFEQNEALLVEKARAFKGLRVAGLDDRAGLERVHDSRMMLRGFRVSIEKDRVALKANALEFGRKVDAEAKRLTAIIEPTERALEAEEQRIEAEKERIKAEAAAAKKKILDDRMAALAAVGSHPPPSVVEAMTGPDYAKALDEAINAFAVAEAARIEEARLASEQRERERVEAARQAAAEAARIAEERRVQAEQRAVEEKALAEERKRLAEEQRVQAEQRRVDEERRAQHEREAAAEHQRLAQERAAIDAEKAAIEAAKVKAAAAAKPAKHCPTCTCSAALGAAPGEAR